MISIVAKIINLFASLIQNALLITSSIGRLIVASVVGISNVLLSVFTSLLTFLEIVYEDNTRIFSEEIPSFFNNVVVTFYNQYNGITNVFVLIYSDFLSKLGAIATSFKIFIDATASVSSEVLCIFKDAVLFTGNTVWLLLTFLPVHLPQLLKAGFIYVKNIAVDVIVDAYLALLKVTDFMTDVPLESFIGIVSAIIIVRLCVHFRLAIQYGFIEIYWSLIRKLLYLYYTMYNYMTDSEVRVIAHMASGQDIMTREANINTHEIDDGSNADTLCIICQERQKCVLTLPCRHVCLCAECCRRLYGYQRTCPICRTFIYHSVTVYL